MLEDFVVDDWDVENGEYGDEAGKDTPEEEGVAPDVRDPDGVRILGLGLHAEEGTTHVDHLPREEEGEPGEADEGCAASPKDELTLIRVIVVAVVAELAIAEAPDNERERREAKSRHPESIHGEIDENLLGKDADPAIMRWPGHDIGRRLFETQAHGRETRGNHDNPENLDWCQWEGRQSSLVLESETDEKCACLGDILCEEMQNELRKC